MRSPWHKEHGTRRDDPAGAWEAVCGLLLFCSLLLTGWLAVKLLTGG
jgi:hypothetical protein